MPIGFAMLKLPDPDNTTGNFALSLIGLLFGGLLLYYAVQYFRYKNTVFTDVQKVKLEHTSSNAFINVIGYEIETERNGERSTVTTKPVFFPSSPYLKLSADNFTGYEYEVGYSEAADEWIVLLKEET